MGKEGEGEKLFRKLHGHRRSSVKGTYVSFHCPACLPRGNAKSVESFGAELSENASYPPGKKEEGDWLAGKWKVGRLSHFSNEKEGTRILNGSKLKKNEKLLE